MSNWKCWNCGAVYSSRRLRDWCATNDQKRPKQPTIDDYK